MLIWAGELFELAAKLRPFLSGDASGSPFLLLLFETTVGTEKRMRFGAEVYFCESFGLLSFEF